MERPDPDSLRNSNSRTSRSGSVSNSIMALHDLDLESSTYAHSIKVEKDFFDQNFNTTTTSFDSLNFDEEDADSDNWGIWSPETEKYWTLQYMDVKAALDKFGDDGDDLPEGQRSRNDDVAILVDENGHNQQLPQKFQGDHSDPGFSKSPPPPPPPQNVSNLRRVTFWVCSMPTQPVDAEYDNPAIRARFTAKVLLLKTVQLLIIFSAILGMSRSVRLEKFHRRHAFPIWTAAATYVMLLLAVKANLIGLTKRGAAVCLFVQTICLIEICFTVTAASDPFVLASVLLVLSMSYLTLAAFCRFATLDLVNSNNLFGLTWVMVFATSIAVIGALSHVSSKVGRSLPAAVGHYWIPTLLCSETAVLLTIAELYQILQGNRIPLLNSQFDWIQATAQLY